MAGYVSAYTAKWWGVTPEISILAGTAAAALLGLVFGALSIRRQGIYFSMITLALAQMVFFFSVQAKRTTCGSVFWKWTVSVHILPAGIAGTRTCRSRRTMPAVRGNLD